MTNATEAAYELEGSLLEVCTCNVLCPCWIGEDPDGGECLSVVAYHFDSGTIRGVDVSGLTLASAVHIPGNVLEGNWKRDLTSDQGRHHRGVARRPGRTGDRGGVAAAPRRADRRRPCAVALPAAVPGRVAADDRSDDAAVELAPRADVWSAFGAAALVFDVGVHAAVESSSWLHEHEWLLGGSVLALAGAFQFTALKDACLDKCRHPAQFLLRFYERGAPGGLRLGARHGVYCVGCCWALMLVMFTVGVASLVWMAVLTAVMLWERTRPSGARSVPVTGVGLLSAASVVLAYAVYAN